MSTGRFVSPDPSRPATFAVNRIPFSRDWDTLPVQLQIGTPLQFSYRLGHPYSSVTDWDTLPVQLQIGTPLQFSYRLGHLSSSVTDWDTLPVQLQIGTPFQFSYRLGHGPFKCSYRLGHGPFQFCYRLGQPSSSVTDWDTLPALLQIGTPF